MACVVKCFPFHFYLWYFSDRRKLILINFYFSKSYCGKLPKKIIAYICTKVFHKHFSFSQTFICNYECGTESSISPNYFFAGVYGR